MTGPRTARTPRWRRAPAIIDSFPGSSIWPFVLGMGAFFTVLALVFGVWLLFIGVPLILTALTGVTAESRRGGTI